MNILEVAVDPTSVLHVRDASDNLLYEKMVDPQDETKKVNDLTKPVTITLYGPGSKQYAKAAAAKNNRMVVQLKRKGKADMTAEQTVSDNGDFFAECTASMAYIELNGLQGDALHKAVYKNINLGFIAEQVNKHLGDWANFTPGSSTTSEST